MDEERSDDLSKERRDLDPFEPCRRRDLIVHGLRDGHREGDGPLTWHKSRPASSPVTVTPIAAAPFLACQLGHANRQIVFEPIHAAG